MKSKRKHLICLLVALALVIVLSESSPAYDGESDIELTGEWKVRTAWTEFSAGVAGKDQVSEQTVGINVYTPVSPDAYVFVRLESDWNYALREPLGSGSDGFKLQVPNASGGSLSALVNQAYVGFSDVLGGMDLILGRQFLNVGHNLVLADEVDGILVTRTFIEQVRVRLFAFSRDEYLDSTNAANIASNTVPALGGNHWKLVSKSGLNVLGLSFSVDIGDHAVSGYRIQDSWAHFDPYTRLGNYISGTNNPPAADCTWTGFTLDGNLTMQIEYLFEYCRFDPDLTGAGEADLLFLGCNWYVTDDISLVATYGQGEERFISGPIDYRHFYHGLGGRRVSAGTLQHRGWGALQGTGTLTGIKDYMAKISINLDDITSAYLQYEQASDYDSSQSSLNGTQQDYRFYGVGASRSLREDLEAAIGYRTLSYESATVDNLADGGGWDQLLLELTWTF